MNSLEHHLHASKTTLSDVMTVLLGNEHSLMCKPRPVIVQGFWHFNARIITFSRFWEDFAINCVYYLELYNIQSTL